MLRLFIPLLLVTILSWIVLYGIRPKLRKEVWKSARYAVVAVSVGVGIVSTIMLAFSFLGVINHG